MISICSINKRHNYLDSSQYNNWDKKLNFRHNSQNWRRICKSLKEKKKNCGVVFTKDWYWNWDQSDSTSCFESSWFHCWQQMQLGTNHLKLPWIPELLLLKVLKVPTIYLLLYTYIYSNFFITNAKRKEIKKKKTLTTHIHKLIQY